MVATQTPLTTLPFSLVKDGPDAAEGGRRGCDGGLPFVIACAIAAADACTRFYPWGRADAAPASPGIKILLRCGAFGRITALRIRPMDGRSVHAGNEGLPTPCAPAVIASPTFGADDFRTGRRDGRLTTSPVLISPRSGLRRTSKQEQVVASSFYFYLDAYDSRNSPHCGTTQKGVPRNDGSPTRNKHRRTIATGTITKVHSSSGAPDEADAAATTTLSTTLETCGSVKVSTMVTLPSELKVSSE
jgi:hypothetical protein